MRYPALMTVFLTSLLLGGQVFAATSIPEDKYSGVVLVYHRVGEDAYPDNSLSVDQFAAHIDEIANSDYTVLPLDVLIDDIKNHRELPPRALAITFEGAYKSALKNAIPLLLEKSLPFTVFYSSGQVDGGAEEVMNWDDLKKLSEKKEVTLGVLPASYERLSNEAEIRGQVNKALVRHREMFKAEPKFFSYPFGEYSPLYEKIVSNAGFIAAFGLQSGTVYEGSDFYALPRFTMAGRFGDIERFRLVVNALPLPATDIEPQDPHMVAGKPNIGFSVPPSLAGEIKNLSCFISESDQPDMQIIRNRVELRLKDMPGDERMRLNCTMPGPTDPDTDVEQWRWLGMLLVGPGVPDAGAGDVTNPPPDAPQ